MVAHEQFFTPVPIAMQCTKLLLRYIARHPVFFERQNSSLTGIEPSCGRGAFLKAVKTCMDDRFVLMRAIDPFCAPLTKDGERFLVKYLNKDFMDFVPNDLLYDFAIGNPPFSLAQAHLTHLFRHAPPNFVAGFLLRSGFRESQERIAFWREFPLFGRHCFAKRISFTADKKTDKYSYEFYVWRRVNSEWEEAQNLTLILPE